VDRTTARARVVLLGATGQRPALTPEQVDTILDGHRIVDADGHLPGADLYVDTFDWAGATAEVWSVKAAMVAGDYNFSADNLRVDKGTVLANMLAMEAKYAALALTPVDSGGISRAAGTIQVAGTNGPFTVLDEVARKVIP